MIFGTNDYILCINDLNRIVVGKIGLVYCTNCGVDNDDEAKFCRDCGTVLDSRGDCVNCDKRELEVNEKQVVKQVGEVKT